LNFLITFSGAAYDESTAKIVENGPKFGADRVLVYDDAWFMQHEFVTDGQNQWLLDHPMKHGFYWFAWKPLIIIDCMEKHAKDGDVVMYTDGDCYPVKDFRHFYDIARRDGVMFFRNRFVNRAWCKRDLFALMAQDEPRYWDAPAGVARFCLLKKGPWIVKQFLAEWMAYVVNPLANTFDASVLRPEHPEYVEHRGEQAILTLLSLKYGFTQHAEADEEMGVFEQRNPRPVSDMFNSAPVLGSRYRNV
jgi:hypothetical protein